MSHIHLWFKQLLKLCIMQFILHVSILCEFFKYNYRETVIMVYLVFKYAVYICIIIIILNIDLRKKNSGA